MSELTEVYVSLLSLVAALSVSEAASSMAFLFLFLSDIPLPPHDCTKSSSIVMR